MQWSDDMELAIELAREAAAEGEVPVGAVVLDAGGAVIGSGRNMREAHADPLAHAEVKAMTQAARSLGTWNLADCTLIVTLEPCPMCAGACLQTHVGRIVFARGMPSWVHAVRFGTFLATRMSVMFRKLSAAFVNRNAHD